MSDTNTISDNDACLAFACVPGIGPKTYSTLISHFGSASRAYVASKNELSGVIHNKETLASLIRFRDSRTTDSIHKHMTNFGVQFVPLTFPQQSNTHCTFPPPAIGLFVQGDPSLLTTRAPKIAIVGSRKPTPYGKKVTQEFTSFLSQNGVIILSGLAIGIDSYAHETCILEGGKTVAVLGTGHMNPTSPSTPRLHRALLDSGGLIVSQYPPLHPSFKGAYPARNKIMAWLSDAILVVEGTQHSGTRITAQNGLLMSKEIFCIPGSIFSAQSATPHDFIQQGAHLVTSPEYICSVMKIVPTSNLSAIDRSILTTLQDKPSSPAQLADMLKQDQLRIVQSLTELESLSLVRRSPNGYYIPIRDTITS